MSTGRGSNGKKRGKASADPKSEKKIREDEDLEADLSNDIQGIISALHQIREKAQKDGQKKSEEIIGSVASEVKTMLDDCKLKLEKDRQTLSKTLLKSSKECETMLKNEVANLHATYEKFCKEKAAHLQVFKDIFSKFDDEKQKLFLRYEQQRKKEKTILSDLENSCADKIAAAEDSLEKKKQEDKSFSILRKSLGSFLDCASDEDLEPDD
ncbi:meiosis-specific protein ASY3 [Aristolochia californica]|uniref:meiosis-specific protein ASY3 n=1 Tax=Aristolochia californica TaxID=171875 RepID=UPI0035DBA9C0